MPPPAGRLEPTERLFEFQYAEDFSFRQNLAEVSFQNETPVQSRTLVLLLSLIR
jgi:hypothetical protein